MNTQEIFNKAVGGIYEQGEQSLDTYGECQYRGKNGTKCAIGMLIDDAHYALRLEGCTIRSEKIRSAVEDSIGRELMDKELHLLIDLQNIHDGANYVNEGGFKKYLLLAANHTAHKFSLEDYVPGDK